MRTYEVVTVEAVEVVTVTVVVEVREAVVHRA
jgi:hypothetical protein